MNNYRGRVSHDIDNMLSWTMHGLTRDFARNNHVRMSSRKKKRSWPFSSAKGRPKKVKNTYDKEWATERDKGSFNIKKNCWMNSIAITKPASKPKWAKVAVKYNCKKLSKQRKLRKRSGQSWKAYQLFGHVTFVKGDVNIKENVLSWNGLGSSWIIRCQNESCPSQSTNSAAVVGNLYK